MEDTNPGHSPGLAGIDHLKNLKLLLIEKSHGSVTVGTKLKLHTEVFSKGAIKALSVRSDYRNRMWENVSTYLSY